MNLQPLNVAGTFHARPVEWGLRQPDEGKNIAVVIQFEVTQQYIDSSADNPEPYWMDLGPGWGIYGDFWVVKKDGNLNETTIKQLAEAIDWDGVIGNVTGTEPPQVQCSITVAMEEYQGKTRPKVQWINPYGYAGGGGGIAQAMDADRTRAVSAQYDSQLRALAGKYRKSKGGGAPAQPGGQPAQQQPARPAAPPAAQSGAPVGAAPQAPAPPPGVDPADSPF